MKKLYALFFLIPMLFSWVGVYGQNLLTNGDFETGALSPWIVVTNTTSGGDNFNATYAKSGLFGYYWNKASQNAVRRAQVVNVTAGKTYKVTINYKFIGGTGSTTPYNAFYFIPVGETFTATVDYTKAETTTGSKEYWIPYPTAPVPGSWTEFSSFVTAPAGVDRLFFEMYWNRTTLYLDDISIVEAAATPTATIAPLQLTNFSYTFGNGPSASKSVSLSAINLTGSPGNLTINGSTNYEVSADNISFGATASIPYASAVLAGTPVYVRLKQGLAKAVYSENVTVTGGGLATALPIPCSGYVPVEYTWTGSVDNDWQVAGNWSPTRSAVVASDKLIFNSGGIVTINNVPSTETLSQFIIENNTSVSLQAAADATITLNGSTGEDFVVGSGSSLTLTGTNAKIAISLAVGASGSVGGNIILTGTDPAKGLNHQIRSLDPASLNILSGAVVTGGTNFTGFPFGTAPSGCVIFQAGSTYVQASGDSPFGGLQATNVAVFQTGSLFKFTGSVGGTGLAPITVAPIMHQKTYANFEISSANSAGAAVITNPCTVNDLTISGGTYTISGNSAAFIVKGNIVVGTDGVLVWGTDAAVAPITIGGTATQSITLSGNGSLVQGTGSVLSINNNVEINSDLTLPGTVNIAAGKMATISTGKMVQVATLSGSGYFKTNGTGVLKHLSSGAFLVGTDLGSAPITFASNTSADIISVNLQGALSAAANDITLSRTVGLEWVVKEAVDGGNDGTITLQWALANEGATFDRTTDVKVAMYEGLSSLPASITDATVSGSGPYTVTFNAPASFTTGGSRFVVGNADAFTVYTKINSNAVKEFSLFPTFASTEVNFKSPCNVNGYTVYDISGRTVFNSKVNKNAGTINVSNLNKGVYMVKFETEDGLKVAKFKVVK